MALVPGRKRVMAAKMPAACVLGVAGIGVCLVAASPGNAIVAESWAFG